MTSPAIAATRTLMAALAIIVTAAVMPAHAGAQTPDATLPAQCHDQQVAPTEVVLTCADAGFIAQDLVWTDWGAAETSATGTASVKTCDPDCASGGREEYPVTLVADRLRDCDYGAPQYTRVTYQFPDATQSPPGSPGAHDPTVSFPCPTRPHADPRIKRMRMWMTGHGTLGSDYYVRVHVRLRVCAVRGRSQFVFNETKSISGQLFGSYTRTKLFRQQTRCQRHTFTWKLRDEFFGVGTYKVAATAWDRDSQFSKTVSRKQTTLD